MATIRDIYELVDRFTGPMRRCIQAAENMSGANGQAQDSVSQMSRATQNLVNDLSGLEGAFHGAFTDQEADAALQDLQREMQNVGLVWTNAADQMEAADLIARVGLQQLAEEGRLAASSLAESADAAEDAADSQERHRSRIQAVIRALERMFGLLSGADRAERNIDGLGKQMRRFALTIFSVSRILDAMKDSLERAPQSIQDSWERAGNSIQDLFAGTVVSALQGMQPALDRLSTAFNNESGQKLARGLEAAGRAAGQAIGFLLDKASQLVEFLGDNFQTVATAAAVVLGILAAQMLIAAAATVAANWPLILLVGTIAALISGLMSAGVTAGEIFSTIGSAAGWLYSLVYNLVADAWNIIASFAEFLANAFNDPLGSIARLFFDVFDAILGIVETVAGAIDALLGTDMSGAVSGFRKDMQKWVDDTVGEGKIQVDRLEKIDYEDTMANFSDKFSKFGTSLSDFSLTNALATPLNNISDSVSSIEKSVSMSEEDIRALVDVAERRYVNNINLTAQTPVINISGQNTGHTAADRQNLANTIRDILIEQVSSGSTRTTARAF